MNNINIIIPALEKNKYSEYGDLVSFGETTLLEWKISQVKKVKEIKDIAATFPGSPSTNEYVELGDGLIQLFETVQR